MSYRISDACINCGACEPTCPVEAITEKENIRIIDETKCVDCGSCVSSCPVEAITAE